MAMYFDNLLDPKDQRDFFRYMDENPTVKIQFEKERSVRDWIKKSVWKPLSSSEEMINNIKNKINFL